MEPAAVVSALSVRYGIQQPRALNRAEKEMFDYIVDLLDRDMIIVEDYRSLGFDGDADLDDDMEWSDGPVEIVHSSSQSSAASPHRDFIPPLRRGDHFLDFHRAL